MIWTNSSNQIKWQRNIFDEIEPYTERKSNHKHGTFANAFFVYVFRLNINYSMNYICRLFLCMLRLKLPNYDCIII